MAELSVAPAQPGFVFGGGWGHPDYATQFEAVAGRWGYVSAPAVSRVMGENNSTKYAKTIAQNMVK